MGFVLAYCALAVHRRVDVWCRKQSRLIAHPLLSNFPSYQGKESFCTLVPSVSLLGPSPTGRIYRPSGTSSGSHHIEEASGNCSCYSHPKRCSWNHYGTSVAAGGQGLTIGCYPTTEIYEVLPRSCWVYDLSLCTEGSRVMVPNQLELIAEGRVLATPDALFFKWWVGNPKLI